MVLHWENAAMIIAIPTAIQLLIKSRSTTPVHFPRHLWPGRKNVSHVAGSDTEVGYRLGIEPNENLETR